MYKWLQWNKQFRHGLILQIQDQWMSASVWPLSSMIQELAQFHQINLIPPTPPLCSVLLKVKSKIFFKMTLKIILRWDARHLWSTRVGANVRQDTLEVLDQWHPHLHHLTGRNHREHSLHHNTSSQVRKNQSVYKSVLILLL